VILPPLVFPG